MEFLDRQALLFTDSADSLAQMARETLVRATLPNFHLPAAVEVLTTGYYSRIPKCVRDRIVPFKPITCSERKETLLRLDCWLPELQLWALLMPLKKVFLMALRVKILKIIQKL